jgi:hypothetical protein
MRVRPLPSNSKRGSRLGPPDWMSGLVFIGLCVLLIAGQAREDSSTCG